MIPPEQLGRYPASHEHPQLYAEQVRLLYRNAPLGLIATLINSAVLVFILRSVVPHWILATWFVCILLVSIARLVQLSWFRRVPSESSDVGHWGTWFVIGLALSGIIWGSAGIVLYPVESTIHQEFLAFVLGGMAIGAGGAFSVVMPAFIAYTLPSLAPLIVRFLAAGDEIHMAMGGMSLLFVVLITGIALRINRVTLASLLLRFEKNSLVVNLYSANNDLEKLNRELSSEIVERRKAEEELKRHREHLEELVDSRSGELIAANTKLQQEISERKRAEEQLQASLREKEVLLKEIHHRVKNNLNVIASLLSLQSRYITEPAVIGIFEECRNRINSMALIHEKMYQTKHLSQIDFKEYLNSLISLLSSSYIDMRDKVSVLADIEDLSLDIDTAMTCGLITTELVTNCLKHAFHENRGGVINIRLFSEDGKRILSVRDNGIGLPDRFDLKSTNTLGLQMVEMLTKQLDGTMHIAVNNGTDIRISF